MKTSGISIRNHKTRGQWAELRFMTKATELGFQVSKPVGDNVPYDVIIDAHGHFISIQVKSTYFQASNLKPGNFVASLYHAAAQNHRYSPADFDYLAMYCIPPDIWYIIPSSVAAMKHAIRVCPGDQHNQFESYREAWYLLHDRTPIPPYTPGRISIYAIVDELGPKDPPPRSRTRTVKRRSNKPKAPNS